MGMKLAISSRVYLGSMLEGGSLLNPIACQNELAKVDAKL